MPSSCRRCQILLASSRGEHAPRIAENLGCGSQTVRNAIHDFNERGLAALTPGSSRPKEVHAAFDEDERRVPEADAPPPLRASSARRAAFWTLAMAAEVSFRGRHKRKTGQWRDRPGDAGKALGCAGSGPNAGWRAPIPNTPEKRGSRSADPAGREPPRVGFGLRGRDAGGFSLREVVCALLGRGRASRCVSCTKSRSQGRSRAEGASPATGSICPRLGESVAEVRGRVGP